MWDFIKTIFSAILTSGVVYYIVCQYNVKELFTNAEDVYNKRNYKKDLSSRPISSSRDARVLRKYDENEFLNGVMDGSFVFSLRYFGRFIGVAFFALLIIEATYFIPIRPIHNFSRELGEIGFHIIVYVIAIIDNWLIIVPQHKRVLEKVSDILSTFPNINETT